MSETLYIWTLTVAFTGGSSLWILDYDTLLYVQEDLSLDNRIAYIENEKDFFDL